MWKKVRRAEKKAVFKWKDLKKNGNEKRQNGNKRIILKIKWLLLFPYQNVYGWENKLSFSNGCTTFKMSTNVTNKKNRTEKTMFTQREIKLLFNFDLTKQWQQWIGNEWRNI